MAIGEARIYVVFNFNPCRGAETFRPFQPGEEGNQLHEFLNLLFTYQKSPQDRKRILEDGYGRG